MPTYLSHVATHFNKLERAKLPKKNIVYKFFLIIPIALDRAYFAHKNIT